MLYYRYSVLLVYASAAMFMEELADLGLLKVDLDIIMDDKQERMEIAIF